MAVTIQQIVVDVKKLISGISDQKTLAENLTRDVQSIYSQIDGMKQYQSEIEVLNTKTGYIPHMQVIAGIQLENKHLKQIQAENRELKSALEDHKNALDLIMSKYREQTASLIKQSKPDYSSVYNSKYANIITSQAEKINEMAAVMKTAAAIDEENEVREKELIARLKEENVVLRQIVDVANKCGSLNIDPPMESKVVQTDE